MSAAEFLQESNDLHARVQGFALRGSEESFEELALAIARFQAKHIPAYTRLVEGRGSSLANLDDIVAVPTDAFRLTRVAVHPPELDVARFVSSGTTSAARSHHPLRRLDTYQALSVHHGRAQLLGSGPTNRIVVALAPHPGDPPTSSLGCMMRAFMVAFDGRGLSVDPEGALFDPDNPERWLVDSRGLNLPGLERAVRMGLERQQPLLILATSLALAHLLDVLGDRPLRCPKQTIVMQTGGAKGRVLKKTSRGLARGVARALGIDVSQVVSEYGMTELASQAYAHPEDEREPFVPPSWLRISAVDPVKLTPVPPGEVGLARFVDLGNVDSAVAVVTQDLIRCHSDGVELLGRRPGAPARGCSLDLEDLILVRGQTP
ncbi:MAG: acyl-protein synthetase [Polyangiaceae bacterium]